MDNTEELETPGPVRLQSWQVGALIARSGPLHGEVMTFLAGDREGRRAALKVRALSATAVASWRREVALLSAIDHPNVPRLLDRGSALQPYVAIELARGGTIAEAHRPIDLRAFVRHVEEALSALDEIHAAGFVVGSIDDGSVIVDEDGSVKLVGFACADRSCSPDQRATDLAMLAKVFVRAAVSSERCVDSDLRAAIALCEVGLPSGIVDVLVGGAYGVYRSAAAMHEAWLEAVFGPAGCNIAHEDVIDVTNDDDIEIAEEPDAKSLCTHESGIVPVAVPIACAS